MNETGSFHTKSHDGFHRDAVFDLHERLGGSPMATIKRIEPQSVAKLWLARAMVVCGLSATMVVAAKTNDLPATLEGVVAQTTLAHAASQERPSHSSAIVDPGDLQRVPAYDNSKLEVSEAALAEMRAVEVFKSHAYLDMGSYGTWTIGYGHTGLMPDGTPVRKGLVITEKQAEEIFRADVAKHGEAVKTLVEVPLTQDMYDALVDFTFNKGPKALASSKLLTLLNDGDYLGAADQLLRWVNVRDENGNAVPHPGLTERANRNRADMRTVLEHFDMNAYESAGKQAHAEKQASLAKLLRMRVSNPGQNLQTRVTYHEKLATVLTEARSHANNALQAVDMRIQTLERGAARAKEAYAAAAAARDEHGQIQSIQLFHTIKTMADRLGQDKEAMSHLATRLDTEARAHALTTVALQHTLDDNPNHMAAKQALVMAQASLAVAKDIAGRTKTQHPTQGLPSAVHGAETIQASTKYVQNHISKFEMQFSAEKPDNRSLTMRN